MKKAKKIISIIISIVLVVTCFSACSSKDNSKYNDKKLIIGYTDAVAPFFTADKDGKPTGFIPELWKSIFDSVKGDLTDYTFEKIEEGYELEKDGGFFNDDNDKEYSASLLMGAVSKNNGTFNEDYSFTEPIISDRIIAITNKDSKVKSFADFEGVNAVVLNGISSDTFQKASAISSVCSITVVDEIKDAIEMLKSGKADVMIANELAFLPLDEAKSFKILDHELDTIEYVIACAKNSGWKDSINEAIRELKSKDYTDGDKFTPMVEKYFGYNASSFEYKSETDE